MLYRRHLSNGQAPAVCGARAACDRGHCAQAFCLQAQKKGKSCLHVSPVSESRVGGRFSWRAWTARCSLCPASRHVLSPGALTWTLVRIPLPSHLLTSLGLRRTATRQPHCPPSPRFDDDRPQVSSSLPVASAQASNACFIKISLSLTHSLPAFPFREVLKSTSQKGLTQTHRVETKKLEQVDLSVQEVWGRFLVSE